MKIERPKWQSMLDTGPPYSNPLDDLNRWFDKYVEPVNKILSEGIEVSGHRQREGWLMGSLLDENNDGDTHKALLINIEPLKKLTATEEKAVKILNQIIQADDDGDLMGWNELHDKIKAAKKILSE